MIPSLDSNITNEMVKRILLVANPCKIILFGSYVWGCPTKESDIDLLVIKSDIKSRIGEYTTIRKALKGIRFPFDIIIITKDEYEFYSKNWKNGVVAEAKERGVVLYG